MRYSGESEYSIVVVDPVPLIVALHVRDALGLVVEDVKVPPLHPVVPRLQNSVDFLPETAARSWSLWWDEIVTTCMADRDAPHHVEESFNRIAAPFGADWTAATHFANEIVRQAMTAMASRSHEDRIVMARIMDAWERRHQRKPLLDLRIAVLPVANRWSSMTGSGLLLLSTSAESDEALLTELISTLIR